MFIYLDVTVMIPVTSAYLGGKHACWPLCVPILFDALCVFEHSLKASYVDKCVGVHTCNYMLARSRM
jgi:hypothetical protein